MASKRKLAVIMFTDIVGYSAMMSQDEDKALTTLSTNRAIHELLITQHNGSLLKVMGDGILAAFDSPTDTVLCAGAIHAASENEDIALRIGIHLGEVVFEGGDVFGDGVNIASRIERLAKPGQTLISGDVYRNIQNKVGIRSTSIGMHNIKGFSNPITLYMVESDRAIASKIDSSRTSVAPTVVLNRKTTRSSLWIAGAILLLIIAGWLIRPLVMGEDTRVVNDADTTKDELTLAVLPLVNLSPLGAELDYFSDGVTQELIDQLAKIKSFTVRAFSSIYIYKGKQLHPVEIANDLQANYLISGTMRVFEDSVTLSIELFDPYSNERKWNDTYHLLMESAPSLQVSVASMVSESLDITLSPKEEKSINEVGTANGTAFDLFLKAKREITKANTEGFLNTREYLDQALDLDPDYAQAHTLMAWSYLFDGHPMFNPTPLSSSATIALAMPHIERSITLNPQSSDIYLIRGNLHKNFTLNLHQSKKDIDHAIALNSWPKVPTNYCTCTIVSTYIANGLYEEAMEMADIAAKVEPENFIIFSDAGIILTMQKKFKEAQQKLDSAVNMMDIPYVNFYLGTAYYHDHNYSKAIEHFENTRFDSDNSILSFAAAYLVGAYLMIGDEVRSAQYRKELESQLNAGAYHRNHAMALLHALLGNEEAMFSWLERAFDEKDGDLGTIMSELAFNSYRNAPRFQAIVHEMTKEQ